MLSDNLDKLGKWPEFTYSGPAFGPSAERVFDVLSRWCRNVYDGSSDRRCFLMHTAPCLLGDCPLLKEAKP